MYATTKSVWLAVISSFWFVPGLISGAALVLAGSLVWLDLSGATGTLSQAAYYPRFGPEGARAILGAIAGGMMTMASLVFSLTFVGLTLVSGQLGPRVFMLFMNDRINQVVLGAFVGIFLFSLIAMANVTELADGFVPHLAVAMAIASATGAFALVIFFVHHMARSIQADVVVSNLGARFQKAIDRITTAARAGKHVLHSSTDGDLEKITGIPVPAPKSGYIGHIDYSSLLASAETAGLRMHILVRPDDHVTAGLPLARVEGADPDVETLAQGFRIGPRRELLQEATYEARALVDIALRALSSGINDPNTAVAAIDHLSAGLVTLVRADPPQRVLTDTQGTPRLARPDLGIAHYLDLVVPALIPALQNDTLATERLVALLTTLERVARREDERSEIAHWKAVVRDLVTDFELPITMRDWLLAQCGPIQAERDL